MIRKWNSGNACALFQKVVTGANIATIIAVALWLRLWHLSNIPGLNGDEAEYGANCLDWLAGRPVPMHTNTGNLLNPFYYFPVLIAHLLVPPSITTLRCIPVIAGIAAAGTCLVFARTIFDRPTGIIAALFILVLPEDILQSRLGWDPCESVLITSFVIGAAITSIRHPGKNSDRWLLMSAVALAINCAVHPTNVFCCVFVFAALGRRRLQFAQTIAAKPIGRVGAAVLFLFVVAGAIRIVPHMLATADLIKSAGEPSAVVGVLRLFSGVTAYHYVVWSYVDRLIAAQLFPSDWYATLVALPVLVYLYRTWTSAYEISLVDRVLTAGWASQLILFVILAGPGALTPGNERYALSLIPGAAFCYARSITSISSQTIRTAMICFATLIAYCFLALVYSRGFMTIIRTGGNAEITFRAAATDPKLCAFRTVEKAAGKGSEVIDIMAMDWWIAQSERYFGETDKRVHVFDAQRPLTAKPLQQVDAGFTASRVWIVGIPGSPDLVRMLTILRQNNVPCTVDYAKDYQGRPTIIIVRPISN